MHGWEQRETHETRDESEGSDGEHGYETEFLSDGDVELEDHGDWHGEEDHVGCGVETGGREVHCAFVRAVAVGDCYIPVHG